MARGRGLEKKLTTCEMTGGGSKYSILLLLFLIHVNDSKFSLDLVEPMLANDTNVCLFVCLFISTVKQ